MSDDLSRRPSDIASPDWHGDVLSARLQAVKEGKTQFVDWMIGAVRRKDFEKV